MPQLREILQDRELFSVRPDETVSEVAARMTELNVGAIVVLDRGGLRGVFSERDLMKRVVLKGLDPARTAVGTVMSTDLVKAEECNSVQSAMEMMSRCGCRHLPVMRGDRVIGFISMRDLMLHELEQKSLELEHMRNYILSA